MTMQELERAKKMYEGQYRINWRDRTYMWHPRNPISLVHAHILELEVTRAFNQLDIELVDRRILDVGCGYGRMLRFWAEMGANPNLISGIDLSYYRLVRAAELSSRMGLVTGDASKIPYPTSFFDLVSQFSAFSSILDVELRKMAALDIVRVLKPSGWLVWYDIQAGKGSSLKPIPFAEALALFPGLDLKYAHPIFNDRLAQVIKRSPTLAFLWEKFPFVRRNGLILIFQRPGAV